ncbi:MAG: polysaccharide deacetylase family protein, partial [Candidatus Rokuibacteriota bacterium]
LRILCYHGVALGDEAAFRPQLFITPARLQQRLASLARHRFPVVSLDQALDGLDGGTLPAAATVITIDDGFHGAQRLGMGLLREFGFPATVYLTSYYCLNERPIFGLVVAYAFWKTRRTELDFTGLGLPRSGVVSLADDEERDRAMADIISWGETRCDEAGRGALALATCERLGVDYAALEGARILSLVTPSEIREMALAGIDLQLHTHRHRLPFEPALASREIADNREALTPFVIKPLVHFCYPSGLRSPAHEPALRGAGIRSATTCEPGLNYPATPRLALRRFLDGEHISQIEFEAEAFGFAELLRRGRDAFDTVRKRDRSSSSP